jgi:hypothetical protein
MVFMSLEIETGSPGFRHAGRNAWKWEHNLDPEARIAFECVLHELRPLAGAPERRAIRQAIAQRPAVGALAPRDRSRDADNLGPARIASADAIDDGLDVVTVGIVRERGEVCGAVEQET